MNSNKSKGLGDSIEKFTKATGIKKVVDAQKEGMLLTDYSLIIKINHGISKTPSR